MNDWKVRQKLWHQMHEGGFDDDTSTMEFVLKTEQTTEELISDIMLHFTTNPEVLLYPAKSYVVGLVYAKLLEIYFDEDFYAVLDDEMLLYGNDKYFVPYSSAKGVYDTVIEKLAGDIPLEGGQCPCIKQYFIEEFMVGRQYA